MSTADSTIEYRLVPGFPNYRVGSDGTIWSKSKKMGGKGRNWTQMKAALSKAGYPMVTLPGNSRRYVHRLVLEAFVGPSPKGAQARHFPDRDKTNNRIENLQWGTRSENQMDRAVHGTSNRGERCANHRLTEDQVRKIRITYAAGGKTMLEISKSYGVSWTAIQAIVRRRSWKHV